MKFSCPECSAKYKVADSKLEGRGALRMKCRKCGHMIVLSASEASGSERQVRASQHPAAATARAATPLAAVKHPVSPKPIERPGSIQGVMRTPEERTGRGKGLSRPGELGVSSTSDTPRPNPSPAGPSSIAKSTTSSSSGSLALGLDGKLSSGIPRPRGLSGPPRPSSSSTRPSARVLAARSIAPTGLLSDKADKPGDDAEAFSDRGPVLHPQALAAAKIPIFERHVDPETSGDDDGDAKEPTLEPGEVAGVTEQLPDEWFLGVHGAPVGPMNIEEFRAHVTESHVTRETLAWKESMSAWAPIAQVPELLAEMQKAMSVTMMPGP